MKNTDKVIVQNFGGTIFLPTKEEGRDMELKMGVPSTLTPYEKEISLEHLRLIHGKTDHIQTGRIELKKVEAFIDGDDGEIELVVNPAYEELDIDMDEVITAGDILDTILNPTKEKLSKVVKITELNIIDRFKCTLTSLKNLGNSDIPNRVSGLILSRRNEVYKNPGSIETKLTVRSTKSELDSKARETELKENIIKLTAQDKRISEQDKRISELEDFLKKSETRVKSAETKAKNLLKKSKEAKVNLVEVSEEENKDSAE